MRGSDAAPGFDRVESVILAPDWIAAELAPGERLIWIGRPDPWRLALALWPIIPLGLPPWLGFAWWALMLGRNEIDALTLAFTAYFGLAGLMCSGVLVMLARTPLRSAYALTDRRVLFSDPRFVGARVQGRDLGTIADPLCRERPDGSGDLMFDHLDADLRGIPLAGQGFLAISDVRCVEALVRAALPGGRAAAAAGPRPDRENSGNNCGPAANLE